MKKKWVDPDDAPPLTGNELRHPDAKWRIDGKEVSAEQGKAAFGVALRQVKTRVNIHLDKDVIEHFKRQAGERGYQTLINRALREIMEVKDHSDVSEKSRAGIDGGIVRIAQGNADILNCISKKIDLIASRLSMAAPSSAVSPQNELNIRVFQSAPVSPTSTLGAPPPRTAANNALHFVREGNA
jgi:uncharacterized protein (DUF4415 family)